jgi:hypothetical protein
MIMDLNTSFFEASAFVPSSFKPACDQPPSSAPPIAVQPIAAARLTTVEPSASDYDAGLADAECPASSMTSFAQPSSAKSRWMSVLMQISVPDAI